MQRIRAFGAYGGTRRAERWWTRDYDRLGQLDPAVRAERGRLLREQEEG
ncbi:MAG TPA: hypothetical protein VFR37_05355 [Longimicrobium sp.]|nr:hypothetical protein [Longimicrobium sp.]